MVISYISVCIQITCMLTLIFSVGDYHFRSLVSYGAVVTSRFGYPGSPTNHIISDLIFLGHEGLILPGLLALGSCR